MPGGDGARAHDVTRITCTSQGDARAAVTMGGGVFRVHVLDRGAAFARVSLVPTTALLLAGDRVMLEVEVGAGCLLEVTEPAGTVAYAMDGGDATWETVVRVAPGGGLVWHAPEFVVSEGAIVHRRTTVSLEGDAACLLRETLVLGRSAEAPGRLRTRTHVSRDGVPLLVEELDAGPCSGAPGLLGPHRVVDQVLDLRPGDAASETLSPGPRKGSGDGSADGSADEPLDGSGDGSQVLRLAGGGRLHRRLARAAHEGNLDPTWGALACAHRRDP